MEEIPLERSLSNLSTNSNLSTILQDPSSSSNPNHNHRNHPKQYLHSFPPTHQLFSYTSTSSSSKLSALHDDTSSFYSVSKAILYLSQFCASPTQMSCQSPLSQNQSQSTQNYQTMDGSNDYAHASLYHIPRYIPFILQSIKALRNCCTNHQNRSCRILSLKCLAILSRSMFAKLRFSGSLFQVLNMDEHTSSIHDNNGMSGVSLDRVEDECSNETGVTLAQSAIMEEDEGISAASMEALAILLCHYSTNTSDNFNINDSPPLDGLVTGGIEQGLDTFLQEIRSILGRTANAPKMNTTEENEDTSAYMEFQSKIMENVIPSRIRRLLCRLNHFSNTEHKMKALPLFSCVFTYFLTSTSSSSSLIQQNQLSYHQFAKRWYEMDFMTLSKEFIQHELIPGMVDSLHTGYSLTCAMATIRLVDACAKSQRGSIQEMDGPYVCQLAADLFVQHASSFCSKNANKSIATVLEQNGRIKHECNVRFLENKCSLLSAAIISTRTIPLCERPEVLLRVLEGVSDLPAFLYDDKNSCLSNQHRNLYCPLRMGLLTELALNLFTDGASSAAFPEERAETMKFILMDRVVTYILQDRLLYNCNDPNIQEKDLSDTLLSGPEQGHRAFFPENDPSPKGTLLSGDDDKENFCESYNGPPLAEELIYAFCTVASNIGWQLHTSSRGPRLQSVLDMEEWLQCSIIILAHFSSCLDWKPRSSTSGYGVESELLEDSNEDELLSRFSRKYILSATKAYLSLLAQCLFKVNLISLDILASLEFLLPSLSCVLTPTTNSSKTKNSNKTKPLPQQMNNESSILASHCTWAKYELSVLCRQILEYKIRDEIPPSSIRIILLSLFSNHWKTCFSKKHFHTKLETANDTLLLESCAREMLFLLENEISSLFERSSSLNHDRNHNTSLVTSDMLNLFFLCTHAVEVMALRSLEDPGNEHDNEDNEFDSNTNIYMKKSSEDIEAYSIASLSLQALMEHAQSSQNIPKLDGKENIDQPSASKTFLSTTENSFRAKMIEECQYVFRRIQSAMDKASGLDASEDGLQLIEELTKKKSEPFQTPPRHTRKFAASTPGTLSFMSAQSQKSTSSFMSNASSGSHVFSPALLSPLHSLDPFKPTFTDEFLNGLFWHEARLLNLSRTLWALQHSPLGKINIPINQPSAGTTHTSLTGGMVNSQAKLHIQKNNRPVIPSNPVRLPFHSRTSTYKKASDSMKDVIKTISGSSDPLSITLAYGVRNITRCDGEHDRHVLVTARVTNITPVPIPKGLRLELSVLRHIFDEKADKFDGAVPSFAYGNIHSSMTKKILSSLNITRVEEVLHNQCTTSSASALFKTELLPYESLTWEVTLHQWEAGSLELLMSATIREIQAELPTHRWVSCADFLDRKKKSEDESMHEDESSKNSTETGPLEDEHMEYDLLDITFSCNSVFIDDFIMLQSCPLVFYSGIPTTSVNPNGLINHSSLHAPKMKKQKTEGIIIGDESVFWFLWKNMPRKEISLAASHIPKKSEQVSYEQKETSSWVAMTRKSFLWVTDTEENSSDSNTTKRAWVFMTWGGSRILCLESIIIAGHEVTNGNDSKRIFSNHSGSPMRRKLEIRCDDVIVLLSFVSSPSSRKKFIKGLMGNKWDCEEI